MKEQMVIRSGVKPVKKKKIKKKKKLNIDAIKVNLTEKLFSEKDWIARIKELRHQK